MPSSLDDLTLEQRLRVLDFFRTHQMPTSELNAPVTNMRAWDVPAGASSVPPLSATPVQTVSVRRPVEAESPISEGKSMPKPLFDYLQSQRESSPPYSGTSSWPGPFSPAPQPQAMPGELGNEALPGGASMAAGLPPATGGWQMGGAAGSAPLGNMAGTLGLGMLAASQPRQIQQQQAPQAQAHHPQGSLGLPTMGGGLGDPRLMGILRQQGGFGGGYG